MARPGPSITRRTVSRLHRWIALTLGLWFAFAGITGSVLVFWKEIDAGPAPVSADGPHQPMADLLAIARREWPASALIYRILPGRADEALRIGLVNQVVPHEELDAAARKLAADVAPTGAVQEVLRLYGRGEGLSLADALALEAEHTCRRGAFDAKAFGEAGKATAARGSQAAGPGPTA